MAKLRAWWAHRLGLDGSLLGADPAAVLDAGGWARSVGGANPYLTLHSRAGTTREQADAAVRDLAIHELPSARGCTYVLPAADFGLGLQVGRAAAEAPLAMLAKLGVDRAEVDKLCQAVLDTLDGVGAPLDPAQLKNALGDRVRNLGEDGRKRGASTTLPAALGLLQAAGEIRRVPVNGRLDQQRYSYVRWEPPRSGLDDDAARVELARRYFRWTGGATLAQLRWFTAWSGKRAKEVVAGLDLVQLDDAGDLLALAPDAASYAEFVAPSEPQYALIAGIDALLLLRRDVGSLLDPLDAQRAAPGEPKPLVAIADLPDHAIVDRGRIVGLWQFDPSAGEIVWFSFRPADAELRSAVQATEAFIRDELGDARSFSLDSAAARAPRVAALRAAAKASLSRP